MLLLLIKKKKNHFKNNLCFINFWLKEGGGYKFLIKKEYKLKKDNDKYLILLLQLVPSENLASFIHRHSFSRKYEGKLRENISEDLRIGA